MATYIHRYRNNEGQVMEEEVTPEENRLINDVAQKMQAMYSAFITGEDPKSKVPEADVLAAIEKLPAHKRGHWHKAMKGMGI